MSFVGFNYRWAPMVQYAKQLIDEGRLGTLTHYRGRFFSMYGSNPYGLLTWRFQYEQGGLGVLGDIMSHVTDMAHMLVGPISSVVSNRHTFISDRPLPVPGQGTHFSLGPRAIRPARSRMKIMSARWSLCEWRPGQPGDLPRHLRSQVRDVL